jgi:serine/threonine protein kinase
MSPTSLLTDPMLADAPVVGRYPVLDPAVLVQRLGEGGMATVYRGVHLRLKIPVAVKVLRPFPGDAATNAVDRFYQEAEQAARLSHENVVRVYDFGVTRGGLHYIVMELVDGETVEGRVRRRGPLTAGEAATVAYHAAAGLRHAHAERVVHRDIKPGNLLVSRTGQVKVADLGIAKAGDGSRSGMTQTHVVIGTPQYMAPELWRGARHASPASDVYALGATLAFAFAGSHLMDGDMTEVMHRTLTDGFPDLAARVGGCPPALADMVRRATAMTPAERLSTADFMAAAKAFLRDVGGAADLADPAAGGPPRQAGRDGDDALPAPTAAELTAIRQGLAVQPAPARDRPPPPLAALAQPASPPLSGGPTGFDGVGRPTSPWPPPPAPPPPPPPINPTFGWPAGSANPTAPTGTPRSAQWAGGNPASHPTGIQPEPFRPASLPKRRQPRQRLGGAFWLTASVVAGLVFAVAVMESRSETAPTYLDGRVQLRFLWAAYGLTLFGGAVLGILVMAGSRTPPSRFRAALGGWYQSQKAGALLALVALGPGAAVGAVGADRGILGVYFAWIVVTALTGPIAGVFAGLISAAIFAPSSRPVRRSPAAYPSSARVG